MPSIPSLTQESREDLAMEIWGEITSAMESAATFGNFQEPLATFQKRLIRCQVPALRDTLVGSLPGHIFTTGSQYQRYTIAVDAINWIEKDDELEVFTCEVSVKWMGKTTSRVLTEALNVVFPSHTPAEPTRKRPFITMAETASQLPPTKTASAAASPRFTPEAGERWHMMSSHSPRRSDPSTPWLPKKVDTGTEIAEGDAITEPRERRKVWEEAITSKLQGAVFGALTSLMTSEYQAQLARQVRRQPTRDRRQEETVKLVFERWLAGDPTARVQAYQDAVLDAKTKVERAVEMARLGRSVSSTNMQAVGLTCQLSKQWEDCAGHDQCVTREVIISSPQLGNIAPSLIVHASPTLFDGVSAGPEERAFRFTLPAQETSDTTAGAVLSESSGT